MIDIAGLGIDERMMSAQDRSDTRRALERAIRQRTVVPAAQLRIAHRLARTYGHLWGDSIESIDGNMVLADIEDIEWGGPIPCCEVCGAALDDLIEVAS